MGRKGSDVGKLGTRISYGSLVVQAGGGRGFEFRLVLTSFPELMYGIFILAS
jgi:hypothetical protein